MMATKGRTRLHVQSFLELCQDTPIQNTAMPGVALVPFHPDGSGSGRWLVQSGDCVDEEQALGEGPFGAVHSPIPGRVVRITTRPTPQGGETVVAAVSLEGRFQRTGKEIPIRSWEDIHPGRLFEEIKARGYVYTPSSLEKPRLLPDPTTVRRLLVNLLQPEPYQVGWHHLTKQLASVLATGVRILKKLYSPHVMEAAVHRWPKGYAQNFLSQFGTGTFQVRFHGDGYPAAHSELLSGDTSTLVVDAESLVYLEEAVARQRPQVETYLTVSGTGVEHPGVYRVRVGTPVSQVLSEAGAVVPKKGKVVFGGPFLGYRVSGDFPVARGTRLLLVLAPHEIHESLSGPCIRCGACVDHCPVHINPIRLFEGWNTSPGDPHLRQELNRCLECGVCSAVCPSRLPLLSRFQTSRRFLK